MTKPFSLFIVDTNAMSPRGRARAPGADFNGDVDFRKVQKVSTDTNKLQEASDKEDSSQR